MKLKPPLTPVEQVQNNLENTVIDPDLINEILELSGVASADTNNTITEDSNSKLKKAFNTVGANLESVAQQIYNIMCRGESETARISAAKFISEIHGVKTKLEETATPQNTVITIHELNVGNNEKKNLINLVMPKS